MIFTQRPKSQLGCDNQMFSRSGKSTTPMYLYFQHDPTVRRTQTVTKVDTDHTVNLLEKNLKY